MNRKKNNGAKNRLDDFLDRQEPSDDFEKEALEGFNAFDREEIIESQSELDARFSKNLGAHEKKETHRGYWVAAAALLIVSGFTGYLLLQNTQPEKDLAIKQETKKVAPQTPEEKKEVNVTAPPQKETPPIKKAVAPAAAQPNQQPRKAKEADVEAEGTVSADMAAANITAPSEPQTAMEEPAPVDKTFAGGATVAMQRAENEAAKSERAPAEEKQTKSSSRGMKRAKTQTLDADYSSPSVAEAPTTNSCYYGKGEKQLHADVVQLLQAKDLVKRFEARFFVNQHGRVDSLRFMNVYRLSAEEQQQIKNELKGFGGFVFSNTQGLNVPAEYVLNFKP